MEVNRTVEALSLLKSDHRRVEALFRKLERLGGNGPGSRGRGKEAAIRSLIRELSIHAAVEEQLFYPSVKDRSERLKELVLEALEEHHVVKWLLSELEKMDADNERLDAKLGVLFESVRHHVREEEGELFPEVRKVVNRSDLLWLGKKMALAKKLSPTHPHPRAPDEPPANVLAGTIATFIDAGRDMLRGAKLRPRIGSAKSGKGARGGARRRQSEAARRRRT
jgi:hemerythrin superfamily protein